MKVLSIVWFKVLPPKFGGQKGTAIFHQFLAQQVELTCLCSKNNSNEKVNYELISALPLSKWQFINPACWLRILQTVKMEKPAILLLEYPYHFIAAWLARKIYRTKIVLHQHNIEYRRHKAMGKWWWWLLKAFERWACRQSDLVLFKTETDRAQALSHFNLPKSKTTLLPYGTEALSSFGGPKSMREEGKDDEEKRILFAGTLDYAPNADAVWNIYQNLIPQLNTLAFRYKILICGRNRKREFQYLKSIQNPAASMVGEVPDIEPYFAGADVFINPVLSGSGMQTKIIDALNAHCNVVSFEYGLTGIDRSVTGQKIYEVPDKDWKAFAEAVQKAASLTTKTPEVFFEKYSWQKNVAGLLPQLKALLS